MCVEQRFAIRIFEVSLHPLSATSVRIAPSKLPLNAQKPPTTRLRF